MGVAIALGVAAAGAAAYSAYSSSKKKTNIPQWSPMDIGSQVEQSLASNERNLGRSEALTSKANTFNTDQVMEMLRRTIPGFDSKTSQVGKLFDSGLKGEVPEDVQHQVAMFDAAKSASSGTGGSGMARNLSARDFGLTSYGITQNTIKSVQSWTDSMARLFQPGMVNVASAFISPKDWMAQTERDKENAWNVSMGQAVQDSLPSRGDLAASSLAGSASSFLGLYGGLTAYANSRPKPVSASYDNNISV